MSRLLAALALARGPAEAGQGWVGRREEPAPAPRRIGVSQVESFAALVRDDDPRYWGPGDPRPVPPGLLMAYALPLPWSPNPEARPIWARIPLPGDTLINVTTSTVFLRDLTTADAVTIAEEVVAVSERKDTRLGAGHFLTTRAHYAVGGQPVAEHTNVMLRYDTDSAPSAGQAPPAAAYGGFTIDITTELCVHNVAATGDFFPGHYDPAYARTQGVPGTYLSTMFFHGLADQLARHARPGRRLARRDLAMHAPAYAGDALTAETTVDGDRVEVRAATGRGPCATATVWFDEDAA